MATPAHIPVSENLATVYRPDGDCIDGVTLERNPGEQTHSLLQAAISGIFRGDR